MDARLTHRAAESKAAELRRAAAASRRAAAPGRARAPAAPAAVTMRFASSADAPAVDRLAQLDSAPPPAGPTLVAEVGGELVAALPLHSGRPFADPFRPTAEVLRLLELRAAQLAHDGRPRRRLGSRLGRAAHAAGSR